MVAGVVRLSGRGLEGVVRSPLDLSSLGLSSGVTRHIVGDKEDSGGWAIAGSGGCNHRDLYFGCYYYQAICGSSNGLHGNEARP